MEFVLSNDTPSSCACPLEGRKLTIQEEMECNCCAHLAKATMGQVWSRKAFCGDGEDCCMRVFPQHFYNLWWLTQKSLKAEGMSVAVSTERFQFWLEKIFKIPEEKWGEILDHVDDMYGIYSSHTFAKEKKKIVFDYEKVKTMKSLVSKK